MTKIYIPSEVQVTNINLSSQLLAGSPTPSSNDMGLIPSPTDEQW